MSQNLRKRPKKLLDQARELIRWKHYSIREERDGNPYAQYDPQSEKQKREALYASRFTFSPRFSELFGGCFDGPLQPCFALLCHGGAPSPRPAR